MTPHGRLMNRRQAMEYAGLNPEDKSDNYYFQKLCNSTKMNGHHIKKVHGRYPEKEIIRVIVEGVNI